MKIDKIEISRSDFLKVMSYLGDAAKLYDALPMQSLKCRAHMIKQLTAKLKKSDRNNDRVGSRKQ